MKLAKGEATGQSNGHNYGVTDNGDPFQNHPSREPSVLIIGAGPAGLLLAYLLAKHGVHSLVVEKYHERLAAPKAHALSPRSLEICRQYGIDTGLLRQKGTTRDEARWVNFCTTLHNGRIGRLPYERMDAKVLEDTPEMIHNIPQPTFEAHLAGLLADSPLTSIRRGVAFVSCHQDAYGVATILEERGTGRRTQVRSQYVVGCDGAKSTVRSHLGIESDGEPSVETMMTIHFKADITGVLNDKVGMLHWCTDPAVSGFIIAYDPRGDMVLISNFNAEKDPIESWTREKGRQVCLAAVGQDIPVEVFSCRPWILSRKVAQQYQIGRAFLAGDAAHSFPPTGGLGLNCGLADVHNLAWKLAMVLGGTADASLLDTYETERRPIAEIYSRQSAANGRKIFSFLKQLGTAGIEDIDTARANLYRTVQDPSKQPMIAEGVEGQREHFDNLELHIGYMYGKNYAPKHASHYHPKLVPCARLPHSWIHPAATSLPPLDLSYVHELARAEREARKYSTLDLCQAGAFTFIAHNKQAANEAHEAARTLTTHNLKLVVHCLHVDFEWATLLRGCHSLEGMSFLVRPDQHILTCSGDPEGSQNITNIIMECVGRADRP